MRRHRGASGFGTGLIFVIALLFALPLAMSEAHAQRMMRSPGANFAPRGPSFSPGVSTRISPMIFVGPGRVIGDDAYVDDAEPYVRRSDRTATRRPNAGAATTAGRARSAPARTPSITSVAIPAPTGPYTRYAPNIYPSCAAIGRAASGACSGRPFVADLGDGPPPRSQNMGGNGRGSAQTALAPNYIAGQVVAEIDGALASNQVDALARRLRLARIDTQDVPLIGTTLALFRITDGRSVEAVTARMRAEAGIRTAQPNFRYVLQDQTTTPAMGEGDPAQYALAKLRLPEAHKLAYGSNVTVAVIDSGIDATHPELASAVVGSFDALGSQEGPHVHGTGIAGAIVSHARLMGSAPRARILAIRAFGVAPVGAQSTSFVILKAINHAAMNGAQVINMSFAGPQDALVERGLAAAANRGIVMVAASGNAGPKSPPLYPAASPNVIAVSATDADDRLFAASNRGGHIAVAAPGVDIFLPAPDNKYQMTSGTSFSAAYVSGLAALMIERNPQLKPAELRAILMKTARDLGEPGRDDLFGAGAADAYGAVSALLPAAQTAVTAPSPDVPTVNSETSLRGHETEPSSIASGDQK